MADSVDELEIMSDLVATLGRNSRAQDVKNTDIILETAERAPEIAFFKVQSALEMTGE